MLIRIVKMTFRENEIEKFVSVFNQSKNQIRNFEGCSHLELWQDKSTPNMLFTYSWWQDETCLNNYRNSELFKTTWVKTKVLFADKPEVWSVEKKYEL